MIKLHVEPHVVLSWKDFAKTKPPYSVALDGYVKDKTQRDITKKMANFDHHSNVDRLSTRSTAEQVYMEINLGLFDAFRKDGKPKMEIYVNDCDEDTILSIWLLLHHDRVKNHAEPLINKLVFCTDKLDCTGGLYPFGEIPQLRKMAWIFEPYRKARKGGRLSQMDSDEMRSIIESCMMRISQYSQGNSEECSMDISYQILGGGPDWKLVSESSNFARMVMFSVGINAIVSIIEEGRYVVAKKSMWINFPIETIFSELNKIEGKEVWGGSNTIGGSLREFPSKLSSQELESAINQIISKVKAA
jgi:hypothetical protein